MLRQRENSLMPILKDILKYKYAPLKRIAAIVMHRIYNDCEGIYVYHMIALERFYLCT